MGKGIFEKHPQFIGIYTGDVSSPYLRKRIDESDCIISIGVKLTDTITGFTQGFKRTSYRNPSLHCENYR